VSWYEGFFGTHPGEFNPGLGDLETDAATTTFTHPRNAARPSDVIGFYEWSPNLEDWYVGDGVDGPVGGPRVTFSVDTLGTTATVTVAASEAMNALFLRVGVRRL
jgi:hypothetical protein